MNIDKKIVDSTSTTSVIVTLPDGSSKNLFYDPSTPIDQIIADSTAASDIKLEPYYREEITETLARSKGLLDGGFKVNIKLPPAFGGVQFEFERKPKEEMRKITKEIYKPKR